MSCSRARCFCLLLVGSVALKLQRISENAPAPAPADVIVAPSPAAIIVAPAPPPPAPPPPAPPPPAPPPVKYPPVQGPLDTFVIQQGIQQIALSQRAMQQSIDSSMSAHVIRQELVARQAVGGAEENYEKISPMVPKSRSQLLEVRKYAHRAAQHLDHVKRVAASWKLISQEAAQEARKAVLGWIKANAVKTAEHTATIDTRMDRLANAVAGAAEPYHLALLRNQKFCTETYSKAKSAQKASVQLVDDSKALALKASGLQGSGMGIEARQIFGVASGMISQAEELRQWGNKLYGQANTACGGVAGYEMEEVQAATNAAVSTVLNPPMKLPPQ